MRKQTEEAERYNELLAQRKELQRRLYLMRLFGVEKEVGSAHAQCGEARALTKPRIHSAPVCSSPVARRRMKSR